MASSVGKVGLPLRCVKRRQARQRFCRPPLSVVSNERLRMMFGMWSCGLDIYQDDSMHCQMPGCSVPTGLCAHCGHVNTLLFYLSYVTLFALAMNMIVKSAEVECRGPLTKSGVCQPPVRAFMDDLTVTTTSVPGSRWILQGLEKLITWARMTIKPENESLWCSRGEKYWTSSASHSLEPPSHLSKSSQ